MAKKRVGIKKTRKTSLFFFFWAFFRRKGAYFPEENAFWRRNCNKIRNGVENDVDGAEKARRFRRSAVLFDPTRLAFVWQSR